MTFRFEISDELNIMLNKFERKNKNLAIIINKKIKQIISCDEFSIQHFKTLRGNLSDFKRVHIGSFVLLFQVKENTIFFKRFVHHDNAYSLSC